MNSAQKTFLKYIRTKMFFSLRLKNEGGHISAVYVPAVDIQQRFFPFPSYRYKDEISNLINCGELKVNQKGNTLYYEALKPGGYDLNLLASKLIPNDEVSQAMLKNLKRVSLPGNAESTPYFDLFLKYRDKRPELFFTVDEFCGRVHTPISSFHRAYRPNLLIDNKRTTSLDVATMQPLLLGKLLFDKIGNNEYSNWINAGKDIYVELQYKSGLCTRDEAKKKFFEILFSKPTEALKELFGASTWINWINDYKRADEPLNPHNKFKPHSNLAWLLQRTEVKIMRQVWSDLVNNGTPFLSVHDEIITKQQDFETAKIIFENVLNKEFAYFKLNTKQPVPGALSEIVTENEVSETAHNEPSTIAQQIDFKPPTAGFVPSWEISEIENYFNNARLPKEPLRINNYSVITNVGGFIYGHLETLKSNKGNIIFQPYYDRLIELKRFI